MPSFKDIKKSYYVFTTVKKGLVITRSLSSWKENGLNRINIIFKDGTHFSDVPLGSAWALINYYYWSHKLDCYSVEDIKDLNNIGKNIYQSLEKSFDHWPKQGWGMQGTHGILYAILRKYRPNNILETGIANGYSATVILSAMKKNGNGSLTSIDITDEFEFLGKRQKVGWIVPDDLTSDWEIKIGSTKEILPKIDHKFDMFYHDSDHSEENMLFEFDWACGHLKPQGVLISDDIDLNRAWDMFLKRHYNFHEIVRSVTTGAALQT
ncbi:MAG: class I SAM-dependent methyltransferase [Candidatus Thermoplasmatota archaeon]|nr:class I SAM-dependent methyltransferase [Candidatus Thermoplasmatota archaeon]